MSDKSLNDRQQRFAAEYLVDYNATQAAIRSGYSEKTARQMGSENLSKPDIQEAIRARKAEQDAEYEHRIMGKYEVLARLTEIARGDIGDLLSKDADGKPTDDLENISIKRAKELKKSHLVKKAKVFTSVVNHDGVEVQNTSVELELYSAHEALRDLGKHHVLFTDKTELSIKPEDLQKLTEDQLRRLAEGKPL